ncbi:hypothetical protein K2173_000697 [Erythroxylum novogranatense]|uniref:Pentatricopeptide repeat-containing protein n=1 Tax=Erythroxylum novogranatense TaxID=1862640 RepID=A0AAV8SIY6_9ROSI|nr:hypothetical protein K2173_000697 [Erythroxylum novogranatense]
MDSVFLKSTFLNALPLRKPHPKAPKADRKFCMECSVHLDPWSLSDGNDSKPKPKSKHPKNPLSDDNARRIIKAKARYLSALRKNQGPHAMTPKWIKRTPEQMVQYLKDDRNGHLYGKHVVAAIKAVRAMAGKREEERDVRMVMSGFVGKLSFKEMCVVLKEQKGWREVRDFFAWMKLQFSYRPSVIVYTIVLRIYGHVGKIKLAEQIFLEMLEAGCEPDEVACGTMLCSYARWGHHKAMLSFYAAIQERRIMLSASVYNFMLSSLQKKSFHGQVIELWGHMSDIGVTPNSFTYTVVISSLAKQDFHLEALKTFNEMRNTGHIPEEVTYNLLINASIKRCNWDEALKLYDDLRSLGIYPSNFTCASLLTMFYKTEDYSRALSLFTEMQTKKIAADEVICGLLIRIYGKLNMYDDAERTFEEMEEVGLLSDEKTYLAMAQVHLSSGNFTKALDVIELMKDRNIWLSRFGYIVLLQCYVMKEDLDAAEAAYQALSKTGHPDAGSCNDILTLYIKLNLTRKAKDFIFQIKDGGINFDEELFETVIKVLCTEGMIRDAEDLIQEMGTNECYKDNRFIQALFKFMHGDSKQWETFLFFNQHETMALELLLSLYLQVGNFTRMEEILQLLLKCSSGFSLLSQLISRLIRKGKRDEAFALFTQMQEERIKPGVVCS